MMASTQGAYVAHWWENPDFRVEGKLEERALKGLKEGYRCHPSLRAYANQLRNAVAFLMTPQDENQLSYPEHVEILKSSVRDILPDVRLET
jgi:hypothetical protein